MYHAETFQEKVRLFLTILFPILITQISMYSMNLIDTVMSGRAGTEDLAGVAIGSSLWMPVSVGLIGILLAVTPIVAQLLGSQQKTEIRETVNQALYISIALSVLIIVIGTFLLNPILHAMKLDPAVEHIARHYLIALAFGIMPLFATNVIRNFFDAHGLTRVTMIIMLMALPFNFLLNYMLIFGKFGMPRLGGIGAGYATTITYWILLGISIFMAFKVNLTRQYRLFIQWSYPSIRAWKEQLSIGVPIGLSIFFETSIFSGVTLMMGILFDTVTIAGHQAAMSFTSMIFMLPLSISMALTIVVGFSVGGKRLDTAREYTRFGVIAAIGILSVSSIFLYIFRESIAMLYSDEPHVIALTMQFLIFGIFYQLSDAIQASLQGVLRGYKDVKIPFITALISYWGVGFPAGYLLSAHTKLGPYGFWIGITIGLSCAAIGFWIRLLMIQRRTEQKMLS